MSRVTLSNTIKRYGGTQVVHAIDLEVEKGEFCVFVGPTGCGKSTLLHMIAGLEQTNKGRMSIGERNARRRAPS